MSDIVEELRYGHEAATLWHVAREAADTIERLRAENEKLRAALKPFANAKSANTYGIDTGLYFIDPADRRAAAAALKEK